MLLRHIGETAAGDAVQRAVEAVLRRGDAVTRDLRAPDDDRPPVGTRACTDAIIAEL